MYLPTATESSLAFLWKCALIFKILLLVLLLFLVAIIQQLKAYLGSLILYSSFKPIF